jgi:(2R)-ethylmalonyl-CoA mutase
VVGGIIPDADADRLLKLGVARVFTSKDFELSKVLDGVLDAIREANGLD